MSTNTRERAAARARLERQMAEKLESARKRRQRLIIVAAAAGVLLIVGGVIWAVPKLIPDNDTATPDPAVDASNCLWTPDEMAGQNPALKDVGAPPTGKAPDKGTQTMTLTTNLGVLEVEVNTAKAPCTARSMTYLAGKNFFDNSKCHRMTTEGIKVLQCGDPAATGRGGPTYKMAEENLPNFTEEAKNYPVGTIAMANTGQPNSTGSQFFIVWGDTPLPGNYTVLGKVTKGIELVQQAATVGVKCPMGEANPDPTTCPEGQDKDAQGNPVRDGAPKNDIVINTLRMSEPQAS